MKRANTVLEIVTVMAALFCSTTYATIGNFHQVQVGSQTCTVGDGSTQIDKSISEVEQLTKSQGDKSDWDLFCTNIDDLNQIKALSGNVLMTKVLAFKGRLSYTFNLSCISTFAFNCH